MEIGKQYRNWVSEKKNIRKLEILVHYCRLLPLLTIFILCFFFFILDQDKQILGQNQIPTKSIKESSVGDYPSLLDNNLKIETVVRGFAFPTGITFLGNNEILLLEKNTGNVYRITDGNVSNVVIQLNVSIEDEHGLLGVAISKNDKSKQDNNLVFLYFTSCSQVKTDSSISPNCGNYLYRYKLDSDKNVLVDPMLILELPFLPRPSHNGVVIDIDNENNVYVTIGDLITLP